MEEKIKERLHELYWTYNYNCAMAMLICLGELFEEKITEQTLHASMGLNGAGRSRGQCGLVEGALMFIGIYMTNKRKEKYKIIVEVCHDFAIQFTKSFGSISCYDLRPGGFRKDDPPHFCESMSAEAILFSYEFIKKIA